MTEQSLFFDIDLIEGLNAGPRWYRPREGFCEGFCEVEKQHPRWKLTRTEEYKPKSALSVQYRFFAHRCDIIRMKCFWHNGVRVFEVRTNPEIKRMIDFRFNHRDYKWILKVAKEVRAIEGSATKVDHLIWSEFRAKHWWSRQNLLPLADAFLDVEGKSDTEIETMLMMELI